jgi:Protein of unknown function (DUF3108)
MPKKPSLEPLVRDRRRGLWLKAAMAVLAVHAALLLVLWLDPPRRPAALTLTEGGPPRQTPVVVAVAPVRPPTARPPTPKPPAAQRPPAAAKTRSSAPVNLPAPPAEVTSSPLSELATGSLGDAGSGAIQAESATSPTDPNAETARPPAADPPAPPTVTVAVPGAARLRYELLGQARGLAYHANATLDWRQDGQRYEARLEVGAFLVGSRVQTSRGDLRAEGLRPQHFSDVVRRERHLEFDHEAASLRADGGAPVPMPAGTQDRLSVFLQLAGLLAAATPSPAPGQRWDIPVAGLPTVETMSFVFVGSETLQLPAGEWQALKLRRLPRREGAQQLEVWFAPALNHLPVRILLREASGDTADQRLR